ncbi:MAG: hypothetical protein UEP57_04760, partial [Oscillospiraceae bacterium]|nr:hypothetical protein [Oscillospiraceae bacterium]
IVFLSGFPDPLTYHAPLTEKVHPSPDALILFRNYPQTNITNLVTLPLRVVFRSCTALGGAHGTASPVGRLVLHETASYQ